MQCLIACSVLYLKPNYAKAQKDETSRNSGFSLNAELRARSTLMNFFNIKSVRQDILIKYDYEKSYQTIELGSGIKFGNTYSISYVPFLRYGYKYSCIENNVTTDKHGFSLDHQFYLIKNIKNKNKWFAPDAYSLGYGIINYGEKYFLKNGPVNQFIKVESRTIDASAGFKSNSNKLMYSIAAHYLINGMASNRVDKFICYSFTLNYNVVNF